MDRRWIAGLCLALVFGACDDGGGGDGGGGSGGSPGGDGSAGSGGAPESDARPGQDVGPEPDGALPPDAAPGVDAAPQVDAEPLIDSAPLVDGAPQVDGAPAPDGALDPDATAEVDGAPGPDAAPDAALDGPCDDEDDCAAGETCNDGRCAEACAEDDPCGGPLPGCDLARGICVACVDDGQCEAHAACRDFECVFFCRANEACEADEYCLLGVGECVPRECDADDDCDAGEACREFACVVDNPQVCMPRATRCDGNDRLECTADGLREQREPCPLRCMVDAGGDAQCLRCEPGSASCDGQVLNRCSADGTEVVRRDCGAQNSFCDPEAAMCQARICVPFSDAECVDGNVALCDVAGASYIQIEDCMGRGCADGACAPP